MMPRSCALRSRVWALGLACSAVLCSLPLGITAADAAPRAGDDERFTTLFRNLVETNTVHGQGSCTRAARTVEAYLLASGLRPAQLSVFAPDGAPEEGGITAEVRGRDASAPAILLLGHLDVVPPALVKSAESPFKLREDDGFYRARGVVDMKSLVAIWVDTLARLNAKPPRRTVKLALTCGEEGAGTNGVRWLLAHRPETLAAGFALNEGGGGRLSPDGQPVALFFQVLEKSYLDLRLEATSPGGHSSLPTEANAIYSLSRALAKVASHQFPARLSPTTRRFFVASADRAPPTYASAMRSLGSAQDDRAAIAILERDPLYNAMLRTTCVATRIDGGHASNALPQGATANINCRVLPGDTIEGTRAAVVAAIADPSVAVSAVDLGDIESRAQELPDRLVAGAAQVAARHFPGVPVIPTMAVSASDSPALIAAGIPVYGAPGLLVESDGGGMHSSNERLRIESLQAGRRYLQELVQRYANER